MASPNVRDLLVIPGKLSYGATDITTAYPHTGGTALGLVKGITVRIGAHFVPEGAVEAEEFGGEVVDGVQQRESAVLVATLHSWDEDALNTVFPNTSEGGTTQKRLVTAPGTNRAGSKLSARAVTLVFTPDDVDHQPFFVLHRAIPSHEAAMDINLALDLETEMGIAFYGIRDASDKLYSFGMRKDITL